MISIFFYKKQNDTKHAYYIKVLSLYFLFIFVNNYSKSYIFLLPIPTMFAHHPPLIVNN